MATTHLLIPRESDLKFQGGVQHKTGRLCFAHATPEVETGFGGCREQILQYLRSGFFEKVETAFLLRRKQLLDLRLKGIYSLEFPGNLFQFDISEEGVGDDCDNLTKPPTDSNRM